MSASKALCFSKHLYMTPMSTHGLTACLAPPLPLMLQGVSFPGLVLSRTCTFQDLSFPGLVGADLYPQDCHNFTTNTQNLSQNSCMQWILDIDLLIDLPTGQPKTKSTSKPISKSIWNQKSNQFWIIDLSLNQSNQYLRGSLYWLKSIWDAQGYSQTKSINFIDFEPGFFNRKPTRNFVENQ